MSTYTACFHSPTKGHQFASIDNYNRDDCGFYLKCIHCNEDIIFEVDTESDLYELFGIERDDYDDSLEDDYYDYYDDDY
jgi:hypothetical protein